MLSRLIPVELPNGFINRPLCVLQLIIYFVALHLLFGLYIIYKV